jgi:hypothetical protein
MVLEFFRELNRCSDIPIIFNDNPLYIKTWLSAEQLITLVEACLHFKGVKLTDHDLRKNGIPVYSGDFAPTNSGSRCCHARKTGQGGHDCLRIGGWFTLPGLQLMKELAQDRRNKNELVEMLLTPSRFPASMLRLSSVK